jgi:hypothetical protein
MSLEKMSLLWRFKRRTAEAILSSREKNGNSKGAHQDVLGYVDKRDGLRRELLSLFNEPSREQ